MLTKSMEGSGELFVKPRTTVLQRAMERARTSHKFGSASDGLMPNIGGK